MCHSVMQGLTPSPLIAFRDLWMAPCITCVDLPLRFSTIQNAMIKQFPTASLESANRTAHPSTKSHHAPTPWRNENHVTSDTKRHVKFAPFLLHRSILTEKIQPNFNLFEIAITRKKSWRCHATTVTIATTPTSTTSFITKLKEGSRYVTIVSKVQ